MVYMEIIILYLENTWILAFILFQFWCWGLFFFLTISFLSMLYYQILSYLSLISLSRRRLYSPRDMTVFVFRRKLFDRSRANRVHYASEMDYFGLPYLSFGNILILVQFVIIFLITTLSAHANIKIILSE